MKTPNIELAELAQSESPAYQNLNDTFRALDSVVQMTVQSRTIATPPTVEQGARYIVPANPTGDWVGHAKHVAYKTASGWDYRIPRKGWTSFVLDEEQDQTHKLAVYFDGLSWINLVYAYGLSDLPDVTFPVAPSDGDALVYDGDLSKWTAELIGRMVIEESGSPATSYSNITRLRFEGGAAISQIDDHSVLIEITGGSGGSSNPFLGAFPETLSALLFWWEAYQIQAPNGAVIKHMPSPEPTNCPSRATSIGTGPTLVSAAVNGRDALAFPGSAAGRMLIVAPMPALDTVSVFAVIKPVTVSASQVIWGGPNGSFGFRLDVTSGNTVLGTAKNGTADMGKSTGTLSNGNWHQVNVTYNSATGAIAYRIDKAAAGTGTSVQTITTGNDSVAFGSNAGAEHLNAQLAALIVFHRVLTSTEIGDMESYLTGRYGV